MAETLKEALQYSLRENQIFPSPSRAPAICKLVEDDLVSNYALSLEQAPNCRFLLFGLLIININYIYLVDIFENSSASKICKGNDDIQICTLLITSSRFVLRFRWITAKNKA